MTYITHALSIAAGLFLGAGLLSAVIAVGFARAFNDRDG